jgi:hypothetical protein
VAALYLLLVTLFSLPAFAQVGTAVLTGSVTDTATKRPVADVVVTAVSPALQGEQVVVTDGAGQYRIPSLPPGDYQIRLEKETYRPYARGGITLRTNTTIRVNVELLPESIKAEEIVVVGRAPTVDVGSTTTGQHISSDFTSRIPVSRPSSKGSGARSFESVADVVPGAKSDDYGVSISGTTSPENQYVIDGLSTNDTAYGLSGSPLSIEFIKEVNVISGGYLPEYGRATGGVLDVVTKSGSNEFHGSVFFNVSPGAWEGARTPVKSDGSTITTDARVKFIRDFGFEVGGPILKDKLWFYAGFDIALTTWEIERNLNRFQFPGCADVYATDEEGNYLCSAQQGSDGFLVTKRIPGTQRFFTAEERSYQYITKLTYSVDQDNNLSLTVFGTPTFSGGGGQFSLDPQSGGLEGGTTQLLPLSSNAHRSVAISNDVVLKYSTAFDQKNTLFDVTLGWHHQNFGQLLPGDGSELGTRDGYAGISSVIFRRSNPGLHSINDFERLPDPTQCDPAGSPDARLCPVDFYFAGGPDYGQQSYLNRYQAKAVGTHLFEKWGHHVVKGGLDLELMGYEARKAYSGTERFRETRSDLGFTDNRMYGFLVGPDDPVVLQSLASSTTSTTLGGFVQDSWNVLDKVTVNVGVRYDAQYLFNNQGTMGLALPNQWSPRVGAIYDPTQKGRAKVFASFARYYESVPLDIADRALSGDPQITSLHTKDTCNPLSQSQQQNECRTNAGRLGLGDLYDPNQTWVVTGAGKTPIDPDLSPQSSDEIVLGGELEVFDDARVGVTYTKRYMNNIIEDMSRDEAQTYFIGNPGQGIAKDFPEAKRNYDALTVFFTKSFTDNWLAQVSYTLSYLRGNWAGLFRPETGQLDPNINSDFDLKSLTVNRDGPLPGDRAHEVKVFGAKDFIINREWDVDVGLGFRATSGEPTSYLGSHGLYGSDEVFILPRGVGDRLPWTFRIDPHVGVGFRISKTSRLSLSMDIFNVFNFQEVTSVDERYTSADVRPIADGSSEDLATKLTYEDGTPFDPADKNRNFGKPDRYQSPRTFRFGAKVTF